MTNLQQIGTVKLVNTNADSKRAALPHLIGLKAVQNANAAAIKIL
jgi:hypothetical protein